jgi:hypothetical protein
MNSKGVLTIFSYKTHYFLLGKINAVNEGTITMIFLSVVSSIFGPEIWQGTFLGLQRNTWMIFFTLFFALGTNVFQL